MICLNRLQPLVSIPFGGIIQRVIDKSRISVGIGASQGEEILGGGEPECILLV
jgi:hypothetical protein